tara:strand:+ start:232 stop:774 length:543 start_codon:yes stop_codon:yes gene_type:complete
MKHIDLRHTIIAIVNKSKNSYDEAEWENPIKLFNAMHSDVDCRINLEEFHLVFLILHKLELITKGKHSYKCKNIFVNNSFTEYINRIANSCSQYEMEDIPLEDLISSIIRSNTPLYDILVKSRDHISGYDHSEHNSQIMHIGPNLNQSSLTAIGELMEEKLISREKKAKKKNIIQRILNL